MFKKICFLLTIFGFTYMFANPSLVEVVKSKNGEVNPLQEFVGTLTFDKKSTLAAQNSGIVKSINFEVGQRVKKGEVLVSIDSDLLDAQIKAAKANLNIALNQQTNYNKDYDRYKKLLESKSITQKEFDDAKLQSKSSNNNVTALKASLNQLLIQKEQKTIKAPYDGVVVEKLINLGEWATQGTQVAKIVNTKKAEFTFNVPFNFVNGLNKNGTYDIEVANKIVKAKLFAAIPSGDKLTRTFPVKFSANLDDSSFFFDSQEAKVKLSKSAKSEAIILPRDAVIKRFNQDVVFFVGDKSQAVMLPVKIVGFDGMQVGVVAQGLVEGLNVVSKGNERIFPNSPLKIINK